MFLDLNNIEEHQTKFKRPIQEQLAYIELESKALGKFETNPWYDNFRANFIGTGTIDGGDSAFHTGHYYTAIYLLNQNGITVNAVDKDKIEQKMSDLYCKWTFGIYRRFPNDSAWYGDSDRMSRDQQKSLISAEAFNPNPNSIKRISALITRHGLFRAFLFDAKTRQNGAYIACHGKSCDYSFKMPTFTGPTIWASYIRFAIQKNRWLSFLYPLLLIFDLEILSNGIIKNTVDATDNDVMNHINYSIWFSHVAPTPWTYILNKYVNSKSNMKTRMFNYFDNGREPFMTAIMWEKLIDIYFKKD